MKLPKCIRYLKYGQRYRNIKVKTDMLNKLNILSNYVLMLSHKYPCMINVYTGSYIRFMITVSEYNKQIDLKEIIENELTNICKLFGYELGGGYASKCDDIKEPVYFFSINECSLLFRIKMEQYFGDVNKYYNQYYKEMM